MNSINSINSKIYLKIRNTQYTIYKLINQMNYILPEFILFEQECEKLDIDFLLIEKTNRTRLYKLDSEQYLYVSIITNRLDTVRSPLSNKCEQYMEMGLYDSLNIF